MLLISCLFFSFVQMFLIEISRVSSIGSVRTDARHASPWSFVLGDVATTTDWLFDSQSMCLRSAALLRTASLSLATGLVVDVRVLLYSNRMTHSHDFFSSPLFLNMLFLHDKTSTHTQWRRRRDLPSSAAQTQKNRKGGKVWARTSLSLMFVVVVVQGYLTWSLFLFG